MRRGGQRRRPRRSHPVAVASAGSASAVQVDSEGISRVKGVRGGDSAGRTGCVEAHLRKGRAIHWRALGKPIADIGIDLVDTGLVPSHTLESILERLAPCEPEAAMTLVGLQARGGRIARALEAGAESGLPKPIVANAVLSFAPHLWDEKGEWEDVALKDFYGDEPDSQTAVASVVALSRRVVEHGPRDAEFMIRICGTSLRSVPSRGMP